MLLTKSIDMLNENTLGVKKARPSQKHQSCFVHATKRCDIW